MSGLLFLDGSALFPSSRTLSRAGWSVVMCDRFGQVLAAAFGPVPLEQGPFQSSREAEDFAVSMLCQVAIPPLELYIDCKGTVSTLWSGPGAGAGPTNPRAHMWAPFWAAFEPNDFRAHKTRAHCGMIDVQNDRTTL